MKLPVMRALQIEEMPQPVGGVRLVLQVLSRVCKRGLEKASSEREVREKRKPPILRKMRERKTQKKNRRGKILSIIGYQGFM